MKRMQKYSLWIAMIVGIICEIIIINFTQGIIPVLMINFVSLVFIFILYKIDEFAKKGLKAYVIIPIIDLIFLAWTLMLNHYLLVGFSSFNLLIFCMIVGVIFFRMHSDQAFSIVVTSIVMIVSLGLLLDHNESQFKMDNPIARATIDYAYQEGVIRTKSPESLDMIIRSDEEKNTYEVILLDLSKVGASQSMSYYVYSNGLVKLKDMH